MPTTTPSRVELELTDAQVVTLCATIGIVCIEGFTQHLAPTTAMRRKALKLEDAIRGMCSLNSTKLSEPMLRAATLAWGAAMEKLDEVLNHESDRENDQDHSDRGQHGGAEDDPHRSDNGEGGGSVRVENHGAGFWTPIIN